MRVACRALVVTTGTFLNGLVHVGDEQRPAGRAGEPPTRAAGRLAARLRLRDGPPEDRHAAAARSAKHRLLAVCRRARRRPDRAVLVPVAADRARRRSPVTSSTRPAACTISCARASADRRSTTARSAASARGTARRSKTRSCGFPTRSGIRSFSSPKGSTSTRSTSTACR